MFNYYKKSQKFNEELSLGSLDLFKWPIVLHFLFSLLVFSEGQVFYNADINFEDLGIGKMGQDMFKFT